MKILKCESCPRTLANVPPTAPVSVLTSIDSVSSTLSRTMSRNLSAGTSVSPGCSTCTCVSVYRIATSMSVAASVSLSSAAVSFTHCSTGLGVRAWTTLLATVSASSSAPLLQITFMVPRSWSRLVHDSPHTLL